MGGYYSTPSHSEEQKTKRIKKQISIPTLNFPFNPDTQVKLWDQLISAVTADDVSLFKELMNERYEFLRQGYFIERKVYFNWHSIKQLLPIAINHQAKDIVNYFIGQ